MKIVIKQLERSCRIHTGRKIVTIGGGQPHCIDCRRLARHPKKPAVTLDSLEAKVVRYIQQHNLHNKENKLKYHLKGVINKSLSITIVTDKTGSTSALVCSIIAFDGIQNTFAILKHLIREAMKPEVYKPTEAQKNLLRETLKAMDDEMVDVRDKPWSMEQEFGTVKYDNKVALQISGDLHKQEYDKNFGKTLEKSGFFDGLKSFNHVLPPNPLDTQITGSHYKDCAIQPIEYTVANNLDFLQGNVIKYITRHKTKGGVDDIDKVIHYCELIKHFEYGDKK